jgi:hypothetical protein
MTVAIDHFDCHYAVPRRGEGGAAVRARLDRIAATDLPAALRNRQESLPEEESALCFIERMEIETHLGSGASEPAIARRWAETLWSTLAKRLRDRDGVVRFRGRADYIASFVLDLLSGASEPRWYYAELASVPGGMPERVLHALLNDGDVGREALVDIHRRGHLHPLLQLFDETQLEELVTRCLVPASPEVAFGATLKRWSEAVRGVRASGRFAPSGHPARDAIVLYLETLAARPDLGPDVNLARWIVRLLDVATLCERLPALAAAIRSGDFGAVRPLLASAEQARFVGSMLQATLPRELASLIADVRPAPAAALQRTLHTDHAGVFLLASSVVALELAETLPPGPLFLAALQCLGDDARARHDAGVAVFAGLAAAPSADALARDLSEWTPPAPFTDAESAIRSIGAAVLRNFAERLGAFSDSSPDYLRKNFLRGRGVVSVSADRVVVRFIDCPMRIVLRMAGFDGAAIRMPWNGGRVLELNLE